MHLKSVSSMLAGPQTVASGVLGRTHAPTTNLSPTVVHAPPPSNLTISREHQESSCPTQSPPKSAAVHLPTQINPTRLVLLPKHVNFSAGSEEQVSKSHVAQLVLRKKMWGSIMSLRGRAIPLRPAMQGLPCNTTFVAPLRS